MPHRARKTAGFMQYPYPETTRVLALLETLPVATEETKRCIAHLLDYRATHTRVRLPRGPSAAVLVPLFVGRSGDLYVLLSRRSEALKAFSGDTALPGGKVDPQDGTVEDTARREAFEEVGIPQDKARVPLLCVMEPHLARGEMLVTPVVALILDNGLQPNLNASEVTSIFAQPLISFLSSTPHLSAGRTTDPNDPYHTFTDLAWGDSGAFRLHRFLTGREREGVKPVFGLTAAILIKTATIGYARQPEFEVQPPNAPTLEQQIARALLDPVNPLRIACGREGVDAVGAAARLMRPPVGKRWRLGSCARLASWDGSRGGGLGVQGRADGVTRRVQGRVGSRDEEGTGVLCTGIDVSKRQAEGRTRDDGGDVIPNGVQHGEMLDKTRDMASGRIREAEAFAETDRNIAERATKRHDTARSEDGESDPEARFAMISKESQEDLGDGIDAGKDVEAGRVIVDDAERRDQGVDGDEEARKSFGKGRDSEQAVLKKHGAKL